MSGLRKGEEGRSMGRRYRYSVFWCIDNTRNSCLMSEEGERGQVTVVKNGSSNGPS
jgi:hypothetical protein